MCVLVYLQSTPVLGWMSAVTGAGGRRPAEQLVNRRRSPVPDSARPDVKYGAIRLSNIVSAEPMAMCMSRYL